MELATFMKPEIRKWVPKGPIEDQKGDPRKIQQHGNKANLPPMQRNLRRWIIIPLVPGDAVGNRKAIA